MSLFVLPGVFMVSLILLQANARTVNARKTNKMLLISLIYSNLIIFYMFRTNKFIIWRLFLYMQHTVFLTHLWVSSC